MFRWYVYAVPSREILGTVEAPDRDAAILRGQQLYHPRVTVQSVLSATAALRGVQLTQPISAGKAVGHSGGRPGVAGKDFACEAEECEKTVRIGPHSRYPNGPHYCSVHVQEFRRSK
jgi:hypothetical protein